MARFVIITSGKGGVGKTTITLNLAVALATFGREILVVDSNFFSPHVGLNLGYTNFNTHLHHVLKGEKDIKESIYKHQSGIKIIPGSISLDHLQYADAEKLNRLLPDIKDEGEVILLDTSIGLTHHTQSLIKKADDMIIVTTPELSSVADSLKLIKLAKSSKINILGVIVNRVKNDGLEMTLESIQSILELPIIAVIPDHVHVKESVKLKQPVVYSHPTSPVTDSFKKLAGELIGEKYESPIIEKDEEKMGSVLKKFNMDYIKSRMEELKKKVSPKDIEQEDED